MKIVASASVLAINVLRKVDHRLPFSQRIRFRVPLGRGVGTEVLASDAYEVSARPSISSVVLDRGGVIEDCATGAEYGVYHGRREQDLS